MSIIKCEEVEKVLVFYLDKEVAPGERRLIEQHLAGCQACQHTLAALAATQKSTAQALQGLVANAEPAPEAWDLLQSRLAKEARPMPVKNTVWNARPAPRAGRTPIHTFLGDQKMRTKIMIPALMAAILIAVLGVFLTRTATPVSAQQLLERAYQVQTAPEATEGIRHTRVETYINIQAMGGIVGAEKTIQDSYLDPSTGLYRQVWTDAATGQVLSAMAFDGSYVYASQLAEAGEAGQPLTLYRSPQNFDKVAKIQNMLPEKDSIDPENFFEHIRQKADVKEVTQETWVDGRSVYVLHAPSPEGAGEKFQVEDFQGETVMVFDAETYAMLENSVVMQQDGNEVVMTSYRKLVDEILPAGSTVVWDLSDMQGVTRVDDPSGEHVDLRPDVISAEELSKRTESAYLLKDAPAGFTVEINVPAKQKAGESFAYIASYRTRENDFIEVVSGKPLEKIENLGTDTYQTASGLTLYFQPEQQEEIKMRGAVLAIVGAPDGTQFLIFSNLPRERVQELAEDLVLVK